jgi:hypothetical protein
MLNLDLETLIQSYLEIFTMVKSNIKTKLGFLPWYKYKCRFTLSFWNIPHHQVEPIVKYKARVIMNLTIGRSQGI